MKKSLSNLWTKILVLSGLAMTNSFAAGITINDGSSSDLNSKLTGLTNTTKTAASSFLTLLGIVIIAIGLIVVIWGIYDVFIDEDQRNEGKKAKGAKKIVGGLLFIAFFWLASQLLK